MVSQKMAPPEGLVEIVRYKISDNIAKRVQKTLIVLTWDVLSSLPISADIILSI